MTKALRKKFRIGIEKAVARYCSVAPREYETERPNIEALIAQRFNQPDFSEYVGSLERQSEHKQGF